MKCSRCKVTLGLLVLIAGVATLAADKRPERVEGKNEALDAERIDKAAGASASTTADGVVRLGWARTDVKVTVDGMLLKPFAGLGSWAAFEAAAHGAILMGDTVVFEDEITPAMDAAFEAGLEVTALHNHFISDEPKVYFMHIGGGQANAEKLATGVKRVWDAIKEVRAKQPEPAKRIAGDVPLAGKIDASVIEKILKMKSESQDGVVRG